MGVMDFTDADLAVADALTSAFPKPPPYFNVQLVGAEVVAFLKDHGWQVSRNEPLPKMAPARGPITSHLAAAAIDDLPDRYYAVWFALEVLGTATDQELADDFDRIREEYHLAVDPQSRESLRTRRDELAKAGKVQFTGEYRPTRSGRKAMVWEAA